MLDSLSQPELVIFTLSASPTMLLGLGHTGNYESPKAKEKRLELEFGKSLSDQGIPVKHQVRCEHGIADIVTSDAIYEVKASLSRGDIYRAASQVLLYRNCINPSAKAVIVGYPDKKEPVNAEIAKALGIEMIVCKDTVAAEEQKTKKEHEQRTRRIDLDYATSHLLCIHTAKFSGEDTFIHTFIQGYIEGYTQPVTIIRGDNKQSAQELMDQIKDHPWCGVNLLPDGRLSENTGAVDACPCSIALERECSCPRHKLNIDFPDFPQVPLSPEVIEFFKSVQASSNEATKELIKPFSVENLRSYREGILRDIRWAEEEGDALALFGFTEDLRICEGELLRKATD
jgi:hypothetical protein